MGHVEIPQGGKKIIRFETRRGDGALVDPDNFAEAVQAPWPVTVVKDAAGNVLAWKPSGEGNDPNETGLYRYGTGQWGQAVSAPIGATVDDDYRVHIAATMGGELAEGSHAFEVVIAGSIAIPPSGLIDREFVLRVVPFSAQSLGYDALEDAYPLIDDAILAASDLVRDFTRRSFREEGHTEKVSIHDSYTNAVRLPTDQVVSVSSVKENGVTLSDASEYAWTRGGLLVRHANGTPRAWMRGINVLEVTWTEGTDTVPEDLKWATARVVESLLVHRIARKAAPYIQVGNFEVEAPATEMLEPEVQQTLKRYQRRSYGAA